MPTKVRLVKAMVFLVVMYGCESWTIKKAAAAAKLLQSCLTLCNAIDGSQSGSAVPGILQARILEWVANSFSNACMHAKSLQLCPTLCDPMDSNSPGSSVHRILYARILEWVAISLSKRKLSTEELMLLNCGVGEDSCESLGLQGDQTSQS